MEVEEEEEELVEQCVEILENWTSPIYSDSAHTSLHQNPFFLHHHQPLNAAYDVQRVKEQIDSTYSSVSNVPQLSLHARQPNQSFCCTNVETKISTSKPKYEDPQKDFELEHKEDIIMKAPKLTTDKGSKEEEAEKSNNNMGMDRPIIPVLVADTFFDKLLGRAVDGIDIASLIEVKEAKACENEAGASTVSANNGKEIDKLNSGQRSPWIKYNFSMANRMPKRPPISGEYRRMPATSTAAPKEIRSCFQRGFVAKLRSMLPSNKTIFDINIDNFGEKMWRNPGVDMSDFFNYGLDEKQWKDYCKLMQAQIEVGRSRPNKITADESRQSLKDGAIGEVKLDRGNDECLPFIHSKDPSFYNADVIIDIAMCDYSYENEIRIPHIKENGVSTDDGGAKLPSDSRNTQSNCRMINWDNILPFPMNSYSAEDRDKREPKEEQSQKNCDGHLTKTSRERKTDFSENNYNVSINIQERTEAMNTDTKTLGRNSLS